MISHQPMKPPMDIVHRSDGSDGTHCGRHSTSSQPHHNANSSASRGGHDNVPRLHPRGELWVYLAITELVFIVSLYVAVSSDTHHLSVAPQRSAMEVAALAVSLLSFAISIVIGAGYVHAPLREYLTIERSSQEQIVSLLIFILVIAQAGLVLYPTGTYLAVAGAEIWNANLFLAAWASLYEAAYLLANAYSNDDRRGGMHSLMLSWFMVFFSSVCSFIALLIMHTSSRCVEVVLSETTYCSATYIAGLLAVASTTVSFASWISLLCFTKRNVGQRLRSEKLGLVSSLVLLGIHSTIVGYVSSPSGPGNEVGSILVSAWMTWVLGVILLKRYVDILLTPQDSINNFVLKSHHGGRRHKGCGASNSSGSWEGTDATAQESEPGNIDFEGGSNGSDIGSDDSDIIAPSPSAFRYLRSFSDEDELSEDEELMLSPVDTDDHCGDDNSEGDDDSCIDSSVRITLTREAKPYRMGVYTPTLSKHQLPEPVRRSMSRVSVMSNCSPIDEEGSYNGSTTSGGSDTSSGEVKSSIPPPPFLRDSSKKLAQTGIHRALNGIASPQLNQAANEVKSEKTQSKYPPPPRREKKSSSASRPAKKRSEVPIDGKNSSGTSGSVTTPGDEPKRQRGTVHRASKRPDQGKERSDGPSYWFNGVRLSETAATAIHNAAPGERPKSSSPPPPPATTEGSNGATVPPSSSDFSDAASKVKSKSMRETGSGKVAPAATTSAKLAVDDAKVARSHDNGKAPPSKTGGSFLVMTDSYEDWMSSSRKMLCGGSEEGGGDVHDAHRRRRRANNRRRRGRDEQEVRREASHDRATVGREARTDY